MKSETETKKQAADRRAAVLERADGRCELMQQDACSGEATVLVVEPGWRAYGVSGAPVFAVRASCQACANHWPR